VPVNRLAKAVAFALNRKSCDAIVEASATRADKEEYHSAFDRATVAAG
jgi:hypothetical protein